MTSHPLASVVLAIALAGAPLGIASGETRPDPAQRPEPAPQSAPGNPNAAPPEKLERSGDAREDSGDPGASLSDRLSRSQGTIKPPRDVDPGMAAAPPDPGPRSMPVIRPPGTSESNRTVTPR
jgi:hypothetical protein